MPPRCVRPVVAVAFALLAMVRVRPMGIKNLCTAKRNATRCRATAESIPVWQISDTRTASAPTTPTDLGLASTRTDITTSKTTLRANEDNRRMLSTTRRARAPKPGKMKILWLFVLPGICHALYLQSKLKSYAQKRLFGGKHPR